MDKYDMLILEVIQDHKQKGFANNIRLAELEREYWKRIENDQALSIGHGRVGERITALYISEHIVNRNGYMLTKRGRVALQESQVIQKD